VGRDNIALEQINDNFGRSSVVSYLYRQGFLMPPDQIENLLKGILRQYHSSFSDKIYGEENDDYDPLMLELLLV
jgi:hypothetical protein